jgi:two-component system, cell cycle response regulator DivK
MPAAGRSTEPPTILIVDDDADARRMYSEYLRARGWLVFTAADGRSGIDKTTSLTPDIVLLDLAMPRVDGWTVLRQLRASSWTANVPIVVVSAIDHARDAAFLSGCDAFLSKPCMPEIVWLQLTAVLRWTVGKGRAARRLSQTSTAQDG